ncbi:hypothetical protein PBRA_004517 [Plasmodiophora brassicae]|uniref:DAGKc domain-containing protein n=2 Tax=Plasmodiophora brassicae TaxID=37360 RepID=A0A0G4IKW8_PLABS|nr:hypothetical protein PBRA_004517 [Plasmodiophora brassicae]
MLAAKLGQPVHKCQPPADHSRVGVADDVVGVVGFVRSKVVDVLDVRPAPVFVIDVAFDSSASWRVLRQLSDFQDVHRRCQDAVGSGKYLPPPPFARRTGDCFFLFCQGRRLRRQRLRLEAYLRLMLTLPHEGARFLFASALLTPSGMAKVTQACADMSSLGPPPYILEWRDASRGSLLHYACASGRLSSVSQLLKLGADKDAVDDFGLTALDVARGLNRFDVVDLLEPGTDKVPGEDRRPAATALPSKMIPLHYRMASWERRVCAIMNPLSGRGTCMRQFQQNIRPLLDSAGIDVQVYATEHSGHATEVARTLDASEFDTILCIGGDGVVHEVVQGLLERQDKGLPIAVIPTGSGNGFCASVFGAPVNAARAAIAFIDGTYRPMDLIRVEPEDSRDKSARLPYSFLHVSWGFVSDIGFDGERYRWLGRLRYAFAALMKLFSKQPYDCELAYMKEDGTWSNQIQGHLNLFTVSNVAYSTSSMKIAPAARFDDGKPHLTFARGLSRAAMLKLLACDIGHGTHVQRQGVFSLPVREVILRPKTRTAQLNIDGERYPSSSCRITRVPHMGAIIAEQLDLHAIQSGLLFREDIIQRRDRVIICLEDTNSPDPVPVEFGCNRRSVIPIAVAFPYGSVVFFNASQTQMTSVLSRLLRTCSTKLPIDELPCEDYAVHTEELQTAFTNDFIDIPLLDRLGVHIVSQIMAQTVALEHYEAKVDAILHTFHNLNSCVSVDGVIGISRSALFKLIGGMTPLSERFARLSKKLQIVQSQARFLLDVMSQDKSSLLEWIIVVLVGIEVCLCLHNIHTAVVRRKQFMRDLLDDLAESM